MIKFFIKKAVKLSLISTASIFLLSLSAEAKKTIAVLPFEVLSENSEYKQFGIGTMDTLSVALTSIPEFTMIDRGRMTSTIKEQAFQQSGLADLSQSVKLGKILGAEILVTGTIQNFDKKFRITASFIDVQTGKIVQASKVTGENIFDLQDQLADQIILLENVKLSTQQRQEISKITKSTDSNLAFDNYTKGRTAYYEILDSAIGTKQITPVEELALLDQALDYFNKAIESDKNYFLAIAAKSEVQAGLSAFYSSSKNYINTEKAIDYIKQAEQNALLALTLSKNSGAVYRALGFVSYINGKDIDKTIEYFVKAIKYNPADKESSLWLSFTYYKNATNYFISQDYDKAIENFENTVKYMPYFTNAYYQLAKTYKNKNEINKAIINYEKGLSINPETISTKPESQEATTELLKIYQSKADEYYKTSDFTNLEKTYNSMLKYQPKNADLYNNLAIAYFMQKKFDLSEATYKKAIELSAVNGSFYDNLGLLYETKGEKDKADFNYKKACELGNKPSCK